MGKSFNRQDGREKMIFHSRWGVGLDYVDTEARMKCPTLMKQLIRRQNLMDGLGEELRVLYVAMTRAKEKLILTGMASEKLIAAGRKGERLLFSDLMEAECPLAWDTSRIESGGAGEQCEDQHRFHGTGDSGSHSGADGRTIVEG